MPVQLGHNQIEKFMGRISQICDLSDHYTNHCIRVTGVKFTAKQTMSVTGHKSIQSLAAYQCVHADEELMMAMNLTYCLVNPYETHGIRQVIQKLIEEGKLPQVEKPKTLAPAPSAPMQYHSPMHWIQQ